MQINTISVVLRALDQAVGIGGELPDGCKHVSFVGVGRRWGPESRVFFGLLVSGWHGERVYAGACSTTTAVVPGVPLSAASDPFFSSFFLCLYFLLLPVRRCFPFVPLFILWDRVEPVKGCRGVGKKDMKLNDKLPKMSVDPETYEASVVVGTGTNNFDRSIARFDTMAHDTELFLTGGITAFQVRSTLFSTRR